jgi:hypothetical protein
MREGTRTRSNQIRRTGRRKENLMNNHPRPCPVCGTCADLRDELNIKAWNERIISHESLTALVTEMKEALREIDDSWSQEGWTPENAKALTSFTDDTIARWKNIRSVLAKAKEAGL